MLGGLEQVARRRRHQLLDGIVEALRPGLAAVGVAPLDAPQVVNHVAAGDDHHALIEQRRQPRPQVEVIVHRLRRVDGELNHRDIGLGVEMGEHAPGAVVDAPLVPVEPHPMRPGDLGDFPRQLGQARRRIVEGEQIVGKAVESVDRPRPGHRGHRGRPDIPVRRHHQQRPRPRQSPAQLTPGLRISIDLERIHRASVADEQGRDDAHLRSSACVNTGFAGRWAEPKRISCEEPAPKGPQDGKIIHWALNGSRVIFGERYVFEDG